MANPSSKKESDYRFQYVPLTEIVVSDYDPEGLELADDEIRSLRDLWGISINYHRVAVTVEQIQALDLASDFNPAKVTSSRYTSFVERTGGEATWECEVLPSEYLRDHVRAAIEANMDMDLYREIVAQEESDCVHLCEVRDEIATSLQFRSKSWS